MTSGEAVKYKSSLDAFRQIIKNEGPKSLFKGAGANILRALQVLVFLLVTTSCRSLYLVINMGLVVAVNVGYFFGNEGHE